MGAVQAAEPAGNHRTTAATNSVNLDVSGVKKARIKVKSPDFTKIVRSSTVLYVPAGTYKVRAFTVTRGGTSYTPLRRTFKVRATSNQTILVAVQYRKKAASSNTSTDQQGRPADPAPSGDIATMLDLVNQARSQRQQCGAKSMPPAPPVDYNAEIAKAAQLHAEDMAANSYFDHDSLDGRSFVDRIEATSYTGSPAGENIASGFPTPQDTLRGWLNSPGHCTNLMDPDFDDMGLGFAEHKDPRYSSAVTYWVQDFGYDD
jgi:uncharacterized protein YkwD